MTYQHCYCLDKTTWFTSITLEMFRRLQTAEGSQVKRNQWHLRQVELRAIKARAYFSGSYVIMLCGLTTHWFHAVTASQCDTDSCRRNHEGGIVSNDRGQLELRKIGCKNIILIMKIYTFRFCFYSSICKFMLCRRYNFVRVLQHDLCSYKTKLFLRNGNIVYTFLTGQSCVK